MTIPNFASFNLDTPAARNNNPGNIRGDSGDFIKFDSPLTGFKALIDDIRAKQEGRSKHKIGPTSSLSDFFSIYAPPSENDTNTYTKTVAQRLGVDINTPINKIPALNLAREIARFEDHQYWDSIKDSVLKRFYLPDFHKFAASPKTDLPDINVEGQSAEVKQPTPDELKQLASKGQSITVPSIQPQSTGKLGDAFDVMNVDENLYGVNKEELAKAQHEKALETDLVPRIEAQRELFNIAQKLRSKGLNFYDYSNYGARTDSGEFVKSPVIEHLKNIIDPNYKDTGIFAPLSISFHVDKDGLAGELVVPNSISHGSTLLEQIGAMVKQPDETALIIPKALFGIFQSAGEGLAQGSLEIGETLGIVTPNPHSAAGKMLTNALEGFRDLPYEKQSENRRALLLNIVTLAFGGAIGSATTGAKLSSILGPEAAAALDDAARLGEANAYSYLETLTASSPEYAARIAANAPEIFSAIKAGSRAANISIGAAFVGLDQLANPRDKTVGQAIKDLTGIGVGGAIGGLLTFGSPVKYVGKGEERAIQLAAQLTFNRNLEVASNFNINSLVKIYGSNEKIIDPLELVKKAEEPFVVVDRIPKKNELKVRSANEVASRERLIGDVADRDATLFIDSEGEHRSTLFIDGTKVPFDMLGEFKEFFRRTGFLPNELVSVNDTPMVIQNIITKRTATTLDARDYSFVLKDPVSGRITVIDRDALKRYSGLGVSMGLDKDLGDKLFNDFLFESRPAPLGTIKDVGVGLPSGIRRANVYTPWTIKVNEELYPNAGKWIDTFYNHLFEKATEKTPNYLSKYIRTGLGVHRYNIPDESFLIKFKNGVLHFSLNGITEYASSTRNIVAEVNYGSGLIDIIRQAINEEAQRYRIDPNIELAYTLNHEIFHPIAKEFIRQYPDAAYNFYRDALAGSPYISEHTHRYLNDAVINSNNYPNIAAKIEEAITNEMGVVAHNTGMFGAEQMKLMTYGELVDNWLAKKGVDPSIVSQLKIHFDTEMAKRIYNETLDLVGLNKASIIDFVKNKQNLLNSSLPTDLAFEASTNGLVLKDVGSGRFAVVDALSGKMLGEFETLKDATPLIRRSSQINSIDITPDDILPRPAQGFGIMPPSGVIGDEVDAIPAMSQHDPSLVRPVGRVGKAMAFLNASVPWLTSMRDYMVALDNLYKTNTLAKIYGPTQKAFLTSLTEQLPYMKQLKDIENILNKANVPASRRELIFNYLEALSPEQIKNGEYFYRAMNPQEVKIAEQIRNNGGDLNKAFKFLRELRQLEEKYQDYISVKPNLPREQAINQAIESRDQWFKKQLDALDQKYALTFNERNTVDLMRRVLKTDPHSQHLGVIVRYARALGMNDATPELSKAEFAKLHSLTPVELKAANMFKDWYGRLAKVFNIDDEKLLKSYITHVRIFNDLPQGKEFGGAFQGRPNHETTKFIYALTRTGEIGLFERDPIRAALAYANAGFRSKNTSHIINAAREEIETQLNSTGKNLPWAKTILHKYLDNLTGHPVAENVTIQQNFEAFLKQIGQDRVPPDFKQSVVNMYFALSNSAFLGARPALAVRDLGSWYTLFGSRFGFDRATNGLRLALQKGSREYVQAKGALHSIEAISFLNPIEMQQTGFSGVVGKLPDALKKIAEVGMTTSGQKSMFELVHTAAYLEVDNRLRTLFKKFKAGDLTEAELYKKVFLNSYDAPVGEQFQKLVRARNFDEATDWLARATAEETGFVYNLANHPAGWETIQGRLLTQYGTWPVWMSRALARLTTRGTPLELAQVYTRFAASQAALYGLGAFTGFNMYSWYLAPNMGYAGGPVLTNAVTFAQAIGSNNATVRDRSRRELLNLLPFVRYGEIRMDRPGSILIPGSYAIQDWITAFELYDSGYNPITSVGKAFGMAVRTRDKSMLDQIMGYHPQHR